MSGCLLVQTFLSHHNLFIKQMTITALEAARQHLTADFVQACPRFLHACSSQKQCHEQSACLLLQVCRVNPGEKGKYIKIILSLLQSTSSAVVYECAVTLVSLSQAPTAIRAAANCYCQLLVSQSDNNVKLIVLDRLQVSQSSILSC